MKKYEELPLVELYSGESQTIDLYLKTNTGVAIPAEGKTILFYAFDYINRTSSPTLTVQGSVETLTSGKSFARVILSTADTKKLLGKYIYQVNLSDSDGVVEVLQGILIAHRSAAV